MQRKRIALAAGLVLAPLLALAAMRSPSPQSTCAAPASWFPTTPQPVNFPVSSNCDFHQWAWQEFLWLMQPSAQSPALVNLLTFADPRDLFVSSPPPYPGRSLGGPNQGLRIMGIRDRKDDDLINVDRVSQAGSLDVLVDQDSQIVYYAVHLDSTFYNFTVRRHFNIGDTLEVASDTLNFPTGGVGTLSLKSAWRLVAAQGRTYIPNASLRFFTTQAMVPKAIIRDSTIVADTTQMMQATLALVGIHVTGTVANHPEFIWATFEHEDNVPLCSATASGDSINRATGNKWSFYHNERCSGFGGGPCNKGHRKQPILNFAPTPVCQMIAYGDTATRGTNRQNIVSINNSVKSQLPASRQILSHYFLNGGLWTTGGAAALPATSGPNTNQRGSPKLANTSMESFTQTTNCFGCHNGSQSGEGWTAKRLAVSHAWPFAFTDPAPETMLDR
jgi:hypothetical protein